MPGGANGIGCSVMKSIFSRRNRLMAVTVLFLTAIFILPVEAGTIKVATYNVDNLFDAVADGTEYPDYDPRGPFGWGRKMADIKTANIARVLTALKADIVCLQEVESRRALDLLLAALRRNGLDYPFSTLADQADTAVRCAVISTCPIIEKREVSPGHGMRNILQVTVRADRYPLVLFVNHWKSKQGPESLRLLYARALKAAVSRLKPGMDYIIAGDFNADYNEYVTFQHNPRLNDTGGRTGINHILGTVTDDRLVMEKDIRRAHRSGQHYNLWLELPPGRRWSYNFFGRKSSLDSIILPAALYDDKGISYIDNSFDRFVPDFLFNRNGAVFRWQQADHGRGRHLGRGYSDHLPIFALFATETPSPPSNQREK